MDYLICKQSSYVNGVYPPVSVCIHPHWGLLSVAGDWVGIDTVCNRANATATATATIFPHGPGGNEPNE
jgi:hypothetical protein